MRKKIEVTVKAAGANRTFYWQVKNLVDDTEKFLKLREKESGEELWQERRKQIDLLKAELQAAEKFGDDCALFLCSFLISKSANTSWWFFSAYNDFVNTLRDITKNIAEKDVTKQEIPNYSVFTDMVTKITAEKEDAEKKFGIMKDDVWKILLKSMRFDRTGLPENQSNPKVTEIENFFKAKVEKLLHEYQHDIEVNRVLHRKEIDALKLEFAAAAKKKEELYKIELYQANKKHEESRQLSEKAVTYMEKIMPELNYAQAFLETLKNSYPKIYEEIQQQAGLQSPRLVYLNGEVKISLEEMPVEAKKRIQQVATLLTQKGCFSQVIKQNAGDINASIENELRSTFGRN